MSVRHVLTILAVDDVRRAVDFYGRAFGWPQAVDELAYAEFALPDGMRLGLYDRPGFARNLGAPPPARPPGSLTATELYFYAADLDAAVERIRTAGARELSARAARAWGDEAAYFADPDGNVIVLSRPIE